MTLPPPDIVMEREYLMMWRQSLLLQLDAVEKMLDIHPRTSEIRKQAKNEQSRDNVPGERPVSS